MKYSLKLSIFFLITISCNQAKESKVSELGESLIHYSKILKIEKFKDYYKAQVLQPHSSDSSFFTYVLYKNQESKPKIKADGFIKIPVNKAVCLSTTHLPPFTALGGSKTLVGFPNTRLIYSEKLLKTVEEGTLHDIGRKNGVNIEKTIALQPDFIMAYAMGSSMEQLKPIEKTGVPIILNIDYLEHSPLARSEWLKLTAVLLDKYEKGDSLFQAIEKEYLQTKQLTRNVIKKPSVMTGLMYGDVWYVPGGASFAAKFIEDAGGDYIWSENNKTGSLELSFETVLENAQTADYWIGAASFTNLNELENSNNKYSLFDAFQKQKVYSYTKRVNQKGANDYLESGFMRADWVLKDYVKILHPELLKDSNTKYFQSVNP